MEDYWSLLASQVPLKRLGAPVEIVAGVVYLTARQSAFVLGGDLSNAVLSIHGNQISHLAKAGREMARQIIPIVPLLFTGVGIELRKLPEDTACS